MGWVDWESSYRFPIFKGCPNGRCLLCRLRRVSGLSCSRCYKVEKWDAAELHIEALLHASNDLGRAQAVFATGKKRRPRGRHTLHQGIRVLQHWPLS